MSSAAHTVRNAFLATAATLAWLGVASGQARAQAWLPVGHGALDVVYVERNATLDGYHGVILDPLSVWFGESSTTQDELDRHLAAFRAAYSAAFVGQLTAAGFEVVDEPAAGVLRLHVEIVDLMVNGYAAEQLRWAAGFRFPTAPGHLTLVAEISDAATGEVLLRAADLSLARDPSDVWHTVRQSFEGWAAPLAAMVAGQGVGPALASR